MPQQLGGGGDDLGATDEMIAFKDEGEQEEKIQANVFTEGDLADLKSSLVNESEGSGPGNGGADGGGGGGSSQAGDPTADTGPHAEAIRRLQDPQRVYQEKLADHMEDGLKHQDPGMYKGSAYSGYPFLMLPDPYLANGSMSPLSSPSRAYSAVSSIDFSGIYFAYPYLRVTLLIALFFMLTVLC